jgi:cyclic pyranopterin phosphate synthase
MTDDSHGHHGHDIGPVGVAVLSISSSRSLDEDDSGDAIVDLVTDAGHDVVARELVTDDVDAIRTAIRDFLADPAVEAVLTTGGTGVAPDDVTVPAVEPLFDRHLEGFGERFRARSAEDVGARTVLSRATAGIAEGRPVLCLPGSEAAVELGVGDVVLPILEHLVDLAGEGGASDLTHVDDEGHAGMVDVGHKPATPRRAVAAGRLELEASTVTAIREDAVEKGDVLATVRLGAVDAVKHTWETIPLCHQIPITTVDTEVDLGDRHLDLEVAVETTARTGPEMEALQGVTTGLNVAWDMVKAAEKDEAGQYPGTQITDVRVVEKVVER